MESLHRATSRSGRISRWLVNLPLAATLRTPDRCSERGQHQLDDAARRPIGFGACRHVISRRCCCQPKLATGGPMSPVQTRSAAWSGTAEPRVKLATADPVQPANQRGRRAGRTTPISAASREATPLPPLRTSKNLAASLASAPTSSSPGTLRKCECPMLIFQ